jgi:predicted anti-sigma-YlaC factor YlaD
MSDLRCDRVVEMVTDFLEGALDPAGERDLAEHLNGCSGCSNYVEQFRSTIDLLGRIADDEPDDTQASAVVAIFREWQAGRPA